MACSSCSGLVSLFVCRCAAARVRPYVTCGSVILCSFVSPARVSIQDGADDIASTQRRHCAFEGVQKCGLCDRIKITLPVGLAVDSFARIARLGRELFRVTDTASWQAIPPTVSTQTVPDRRICYPKPMFRATPTCISTLGYEMYNFSVIVLCGDHKNALVRNMT